jgi:hypothetical protein
MVRAKMEGNKEYSSIQVTKKFQQYLKRVKDKNHFDSYENVIRFLIARGRKK